MISVATLTAIINQVLPEPHAGLLAGILFGTKATLSKDLYNNLITTGTLHIVALSGMNITILTSLVGTLLLRFVSRRISGLLTCGIIIGFVWFVGPTPSVVRAAIMGCIGLLATVLGRQTWSLFSLFLASGIMLLVSPGWLGDISFQLSFLATLGIVLFGKKKKRSMVDAGNSKLDLEVERLKIENQISGFYSLSSKFWSVIYDDLHLTLAAQVFTIPLILFQFHQISLVAPLSNILIGWIIPPLTLIGILTVVLGLLWLPLGQMVAWISWLMLTYMLIVIHLTSRIPFASIRW